MEHVNVHRAKTQLSQLLRRVESGEEIVISRAGEPVAKLVPYARTDRRSFGMDRGRFEVPEDFDAPLPEDLLEEFEG
ncbi:MAG: type II toxin-antitoxin system Phd/YefM family antitoxin [Deltaproteobacteria bacterium]|nr:type II toxin-antitoxin system Phd/YefM family antitoxin [Deltaproteobacteria bacterium]